ncbi:hypothetical protein TRFO_42873 [Tritrichomonas foetus]|uniref:Protein kinase domain-containing protein n=1 Tax=Tritrichomonas foetus TaxID=1144522 RepID=A0A1J4KU65_9EUKA|nr:hypothetical protein TRFO_42873 [Tritrichomonas foetus]|eukprot:OHT14807.1 hypothetical protein TRFO_42873 [Tritrichomonas foetus]
MSRVLYSAGQNSCNQLGRGGDSKDPCPIIEFSTFGLKSISCGNGFTVAVFENGDAYGWGFNESGCIGFDDRKEKNLPRKFESIHSIKMASCGDNETVFLKDNGDVYVTTPNNGIQKVEIPEKIKYIDSNSQKTWMVAQSGAVYSINNSSFSNLNNSGNNSYIKFDKYENVCAKSVSAGSGFAVVINENDNDQLYGIGKMISNLDKFERIDSLYGHSIEKVVSFNEHSIVLTKMGKVYVWGKGTFGNLGLGNSIRDTENKFIELSYFNDKSIVDIGAGNAFSCFVGEDGSFYSCGLSKDGRTMMGDTVDRKTPEKSTKIFNALNVFCGSSHTIVICKGDEEENQTKYESVEQLLSEIESLKKENTYLKDENYRLKSANSSLEAENSKLHKAFQKANIKLKGSQTNPLKCFDEEDLKKMRKVEKIISQNSQNSETYKLEIITAYSAQYFNVSNEDFSQFLNSHMQILTTLHPCLSRVIGYCNCEQQQPCLIYENYEKNLENAVLAESFSPTQKVKMIVEILLGMRFLHSFNSLHRNLNPSNILLESDSNHEYSVRITEIDVRQNSEHMYTAPETLSSNGEIYDKKSDVFSFGTIVYFILSDGGLPNEFRIQDNSFNDAAKEIIESCWIPNPEKRITFNELFEKVQQHHFKLTKDVNIQQVERRVEEIDAFEKKNDQHIVFSVKPPIHPPGCGSNENFNIPVSPRLHSTRKPSLTKPIHGILRVSK